MRLCGKWVGRVLLAVYTLTTEFARMCCQYNHCHNCRPIPLCEYDTGM